MRPKHSVICMVAVFLLAMMATPGAFAALSQKEQLGKAIFFDENLSINNNQSCAACHAPEVGWTGPDSAINAAGAVYPGSIPERFGNRKPPSSAYATFSPVFRYFHRAGGGFLGGNFWDGRATGEKLGNPAADQAQGPFLNPVEQALPNAAEVVARVCGASYAELFTTVWGDDACADVDKAFGYIALSIAAYEGSREVSPFSSKYDAYLAGKARLTRLERQGLRLFQTKGKCDNCHTSVPRANGKPPLFADFTYDNLGVPKNPQNPFYTMDEVFVDDSPVNPLGKFWIDPGLGGFLATRDDYAAFARANLGKFKVPTLRNVDKRPSPGFIKAYGHNGYFKSIKGIVHFYNTRDVLPVCTGPVTEAEALTQGCWPLPELALNMNTTEMGNLGLTEAEENAIVAFLKTLNDGYTPGQ